MSATQPTPDLDPVVWTPPPDPGLTGPYARNDLLATADVWPMPGSGPEDVVVSDDGVVHAGTRDGSLFAVTDEGDTIRRVARTGGRPLGLELLGDGRLLVCDADRGLLAVDPDSGEVETLVDEVDSEPLRFTNNATVATDGTIYFTDSSRRFSVHDYRGDLLEHSGTGRLLRRSPDGEVSTLIDGLQFPNGVALSEDETFLILSETGMFRLNRVWLTGEREGQWEVFAEMPAYPDNVSRSASGTYWCAAASARLALMDRLADKPPALRKAVWKLPDALKPSPAKMALVFGYDAEGRVIHNLQLHDDDRFTVATGAREHDGWLYIGSLVTPAILRYRLS